MINTNVILTREQKSAIAEALDVSLDDLEELRIKASNKRKTSFKDDFSMIFKTNIGTLAKMKLTPTSFRIIIYLFSIIDYGNILVNFSQSRVAKDLGLQKSNVSRAFKELFEKKILIRNAEDDHVYLNSNLCVKGFLINLMRSKWVNSRDPKQKQRTLITHLVFIVLEKNNRE